MIMNSLLKPVSEVGGEGFEYLLVHFREKDKVLTIWAIYAKHKNYYKLHINNIINM